jgi:hypothetical protein
MEETKGVLRRATGSPGARSHFYTRYLGGNRFIMRARFDE